MNDLRTRYIEYLTTERDQRIRQIGDEIAALRPMGQASELSAAMGLRPKRGVCVGTPLGTFVFAKDRRPTEEQVDRWQELWRSAENYGRSAAEAGSFQVIDAGCTIGNASYMVTGCKLRDFDVASVFGPEYAGQSLLDEEEQKFLNLLIKFWNQNVDDNPIAYVADDGTIAVA